MEFDGFNWDRGNRGKCRKHGLTIAEIESVFDLPVVILPDNANREDEGRHRAVGTTPERREVFVVSTPRDHGDTVLLRPISARSHAQEKGGGR
jgi:uncharacterized DUF497 family protein